MLKTVQSLFGCSLVSLAIASAASAQSPAQPPLAFTPPAGIPTSAQATGTAPYAIVGLQAQIKTIMKAHVAAQTDGLIEQLLVEEGATVKKGDLLLRIDDRLARAELGVAKKEAEAAAAQAKQDANLRFSKKVAEVSVAEYEEWKELYERNSASYQEVRRKMLEAQKAQLGIEVADVDHTKDILTAEVAKEKVQAATVQLDLRSVLSKFDGVIVERLRNEGEWVKAGEPILRVIHLNEMRVESRVPLKNISTVQLQGAPIKVHVNISGRDHVFDSVIEFVSAEIELDECRIWTKVPNTVVGGAWLLSDGLAATIDITPKPVP